MTHKERFLKKAIEIGHSEEEASSMFDLMKEAEKASIEEVPDGFILWKDEEPGIGEIITAFSEYGDIFDAVYIGDIVVPFSSGESMRMVRLLAWRS